MAAREGDDDDGEGGGGGESAESWMAGKLLHLAEMVLNAPEELCDSQEALSWGEGGGESGRERVREADGTSDVEKEEEGRGGARGEGDEVSARALYVLMKALKSTSQDVREDAFRQAPAVVDALCRRNRAITAANKRAGREAATTTTTTTTTTTGGGNGDEAEAFAGFEVVMSILGELMTIFESEQFFDDDAESIETAEACVVDVVRAFIERQREVYSAPTSAPRCSAESVVVASGSDNCQKEDGSAVSAVVTRRTHQFAILDEILRLIKGPACREGEEAGTRADDVTDELRALLLRIVFRVLPDFDLDIVVCAFSMSATSEAGDAKEAAPSLLQLVHSIAATASFEVKKELPAGLVGIARCCNAAQRTLSTAPYVEEVLAESMAFFDTLSRDDTWIVRCAAVHAVPSLVDAILGVPSADAYVRLIADRVLHLEASDSSRQVANEATKVVGHVLAGFCSFYRRLDNGDDALSRREALVSLLKAFRTGCVDETGIGRHMVTSASANVAESCAASFADVVEALVKVRFGIDDDDDNDNRDDQNTDDGGTDSAVRPHDDDTKNAHEKEIQFETYVSTCLQSLSMNANATVRRLLVASAPRILQNVRSMPERTAADANSAHSAPGCAHGNEAQNALDAGNEASGFVAAEDMPDGHSSGSSSSSRAQLVSEIVRFFVISFHDELPVRDAAVACLGAFIESVGSRFGDSLSTVRTRRVQKRQQLLVISEILSFIFERRFVDDDGDLIDDRTVSSGDSTSTESSSGATDTHSNACSLCTDWRVRESFAAQVAQLIATTHEPADDAHAPCVSVTIATVLLRCCCISLISDPVAAVRSTAAEQMCAVWRWMFTISSSQALTTASGEVGTIDVALESMIADVVTSLRGLAEHASFHFRQTYVDIVMSIIADVGDDPEDGVHEFLGFTCTHLQIASSIARLSADKIVNVRFCLAEWLQKVVNRFSRSRSGLSAAQRETGTCVPPFIIDAIDSLGSDTDGEISRILADVRKDFPLLKPI